MISERMIRKPVLFTVDEQRKWEIMTNVLPLMQDIKEEPEIPFDGFWERAERLYYAGYLGSLYSNNTRRENHGSK